MTNSSSFELYKARYEKGLEPCPRREQFDTWLKAQKQKPGLPVDSENRQVVQICFETDQPDDDYQNTYADPDEFAAYVEQEMKGADIAVGGYGEHRPFYRSPAYQPQRDQQQEWRTVHLGWDIWSTAGTAVVAPFGGEVVGFADNQGKGNYGPTIILYHQLSDDFGFYTLYGHLSRNDLSGISEGDKISQGSTFAHFGAYRENGFWPPHLHFQVMLDLLDYKGDFPGVATSSTAPIWLSICPHLYTDFESNLHPSK